MIFGSACASYRHINKIHPIVICDIQNYVKISNSTISKHLRPICNPASICL
ncbi:ArsR family transcriptional regulator [[Clostridium] symbiosum]|nr:ArsR family transcriptional regulator [[Clostridium] symbiosum]